MFLVFCWVIPSPPPPLSLQGQQANFLNHGTGFAMFGLKPASLLSVLLCTTQLCRHTRLNRRSKPRDYSQTVGQLISTLLLPTTTQNNGLLFTSPFKIKVLGQRRVSASVNHTDSPLPRFPKRCNKWFCSGRTFFLLQFYLPSNALEIFLSLHPNTERTMNVFLFHVCC